MRTETFLPKTAKSAYRILGVLAVVATLLTSALAPSTAAHAAPQAEEWDPRWGIPGIPDGTVEAMATAANGDVYVAGSLNIPSVGAKNIARWDGDRWHALAEGLGPDGVARAYGVSVNGADVYVVGNFTGAGNIGANAIARWDGAQWHNVGNGTGPKRRTDYGLEDGQLYAIAIAANGDVVVGGYFNEIDGVKANSVARWNGTAWSALGDGITDPGFEEGTFQAAKVYALAFAGDGALVTGGEFKYAGNVTTNSIARWDGADWSALGSGIITNNGVYDSAGIVHAIAINGNGLFAGGTFNTAGGASAINIAAWNGAAWSALGTGATMQFESDPVVMSLMMNGTTLIAGGKFSRAGNQNMQGIAQWNGTTWLPMPEPLRHDYGVEVHALAKTAGNTFFAGGAFVGAGTARMVFNIARWTGDRWANLGEGITPYSDSPADVLAIATDDQGNVYAGGQMPYAGGNPVKQIAMWDGTRWNDMNGGVSGGSSLVYAILPIGDDIYVGGSFSQAGNVSASNIAKWNRTTGAWSDVGGGIDGTVYSLTFGNGKIYAGGGFKRAGAAVVEDVAIWDGQSWTGLGGQYEIFEIFDNGSEAGTYVSSLVYDQGELYMAGHFQTIHKKGTSTAVPANYTVVHNVVSYRFADQGWYLLGSAATPGVTTDGSSGFFTTANTLAVVGDWLFVGGEFNRAGGAAAIGIARFNMATNTWDNIGNIGGNVDKLTIRSLSALGADVYVAGAFTSIGATPARYVAKWNTNMGTWSALGNGLSWYNDRFVIAKAIYASEDGVFVGGKFDHAGPHPALGFAQWAATFTPPPPPPPPPGDVRVYLPLVRR